MYLESAKSIVKVVWKMSCIWNDVFDDVHDVFERCQTRLAKFKEKYKGHWGIRTFTMQIDMGVIKRTKDNNYKWNRFTQNENECFLGTSTNQLI